MRNNTVFETVMTVYHVCPVYTPLEYCIVAIDNAIGP